MKTKLSEKCKWSLVGVFAILILISCGFAIKEINTVHTKGQENIIYTYQTDAVAPYEVYLKPNVLYQQEKLGSDLTYLSEFVSNIKVNFQHIFEGVEKQNMTGYYTVVARLQGYYMNEDTKTIIWSKEEVLVPKKTINEQVAQQRIAEEVSLDFQKYNAYVKEVLEASKASSSVELQVVLEGQLDTTANGQSISVPLQMVTTIPLQMSYFTIAQEGMGSNQQDFKETIMIDLPPNKSVILGCISMAIVSVLGILYLIFFTIQPSEEDVYEKKVKKILREHGSRMVAVDSVYEEQFQKVYKVYEMADLIKIADELEKPVYYSRNEILIQINSFYVEEQHTLYCYKVDS